MSKSFEINRFLGVSLSGGKSDKTCVALLEYYPEHGKVFLSRLFEKIGGKKKGLSSDELLLDILSKVKKPIEKIAFDSPISLPKCINCRLRCPGVDKCRVSSVKWMSELYKEKVKKHKTLKPITPYTQRPIELYLRHELEEAFYCPEALGANIAPLTARTQFLLKTIKYPVVEVFPKLSIWRIGNSLKIPKSHLRYHKHATSGNESRAAILKLLTDKNVAFIYQQDVKTMIKDNFAFEAFIVGLTAYLDFRKQCEKRPKNFPRQEEWIKFPKIDISW